MKRSGPAEPETDLTSWNSTGGRTDAAPALFVSLMYSNVQSRFITPSWTVALETLSVSSFDTMVVTVQRLVRGVTSGSVTARAANKSPELGDGEQTDPCSLHCTRPQCVHCTWCARHCRHCGLQGAAEVEVACCTAPDKQVMVKNQKVKQQNINK